ncbi:hypothetical protein Acel_0219 [Acidothermus cellulolyticus 11B]|uniref:Uncharacterized protein n=1 Tax=Acidothermus cellulolyticus (strain ATCC 43068 / DSM 8971 / 11B) TaxID=351607 RepID=A0LRD3_ACIC1|nr:hypothetical protein Acel_0219 [Acidothermus cellulolyticus 11B]
MRSQRTTDRTLTDTAFGPTDHGDGPTITPGNGSGPESSRQCRNVGPDNHSLRRGGGPDNARHGRKAAGRTTLVTPRQTAGPSGVPNHMTVASPEGGRARAMMRGALAGRRRCGNRMK